MFPSSRSNPDGALSRSRGSVLPSVLALTMTVAALAAVTTSALFTDTQAVAGNTFATGSVALSTTDAATFDLTMSSMAPGDSDTGQMLVTNSGSLQNRYAVTSATTEDVLAAQLDMTIWLEADETTSDGTCAATPPVTRQYDGLALGSSAGTNVVGNPTQGNQAGDRLLAAGASEVLCFLVSLPSATGNAYESLTTTATFSFVAEQTTNNA